MRAFKSSPARAQVRYVFGIAYVVLGFAIAAQMLHGVGLRFEALPGLVLGAAMIGLGVLRTRGGWPRRTAP